MKVNRLIAGWFLISGIFLTGCLSMKSYVQPEFTPAAVTELKERAQPTVLLVKTEFTRKGKPAMGGGTFERAALRSLESSKLFSEVKEGEGRVERDHLFVTMENVADIGDAMSKGFSTGATFGGVGNQVKDGYVFKATFTPAGGPPVKKEYEHAIHTIIGNKEFPAGKMSFGVMAAFDQVVSDLMTTLLRDLQRDGYLQ